MKQETINKYNEVVSEFLKENHDKIAKIDKMGTDEIDIQDIHNALAVSVTNAKLSEDIFVNVFLPYFYNGQSQYGVTFEHWMSVCGGTPRPVDIINSAGDIVLTIDEPFDTSVINPAAGAISLTEVVSQSVAYGRVNKNAGREILNNEIERRGLIKSDGRTVLKNIQKWNKIFAKYGYEEILGDLVNELLADAGENVSDKETSTSSKKNEPPMQIQNWEIV